MFSLVNYEFDIIKHSTGQSKQSLLTFPFESRLNMLIKLSFYQAVWGVIHH